RSMALLVALAITKPAAAATTQVLVQANLNSSSMNFVCLLQGCRVTQVVNGSPGNFYVLSVSGWVNIQFLSNALLKTPGILNAAVLDASNSPSENRYIVHTTGGMLSLPALCSLNLCHVIQPLDGGLNQVFLLGGPDNQDPNFLLAVL